MRKVALVGVVLLFLAVCSFTAIADNPGDTFVVNTNWTITDPQTGAGYFNPGYGVDPDPGRPDHLPAYNDYDFMYTDSLGVTSSTLQHLLVSWDAFCQPEIDGVDVLNRIQDLQPGVNRIQIVINHVILEGLEQEPLKAMFTITFPPYFSVDNANRYPVVINGTGYGAKGLNNSIFTDLPFDLTRVKDAYLFDEQSRGLVYVRWNVGGYHSLGVNDEARYAISELIGQLHDNYGCDKDKIIAFGASRAGFAALTLAQNNAHQVHDYNVIGVFARSAPISLGKLSQAPVSTYPAFAATYNVNLGPGAYRYDEDPPGGMNPDLLLPAFGPADDNTPMEQRADQLCPDHPDNLATLQGKYVFLSYSAHDSFFPLNFFIDMDNWLSNNGVRHTSCISLQGGHGSAAETVANTVFKDFVDYVLNEEDFDPAGYNPPNCGHGLFENARNYYLETDLTYHQEEIVPLALSELPFSLTLPHRLGCNVFGDGQPGVADEPGILFLSGAAGKAWEVSVRTREPDGEQSEPHTWSGVFDENETGIIKWWPERIGWDGFPVAASASGGPFDPDNDRLEWSVIYDGIDYTAFTNWKLDGVRLPPETEIMQNQPWINQLYASYGADGDTLTSFGFDAIPPLPWVDFTCTPSSGTAPVAITCSLTAGSYVPGNRTLAYSVDITLADGTVLPDHWTGTMNVGADEALTHNQVYDYFEESCVGVNRYDVSVTDVTPAPFNQPPFPPSGMTGSSKAVVTITAPLSDPVRQQQWLLNSSPGWTADGDWDLGQPLGAGGENGGPDPSSGWTGTNAFGYNLAGDYANNMPATNLTTAPFNCSDSTETRLKFRRWLGVEGPAHDRAAVRVSADGGAWVTVWENETEITDTSWVSMDIDIASVADGHENVRVRWTMGPTDGANTYCGWNIDDVEIWGKKSIVPTIMDDLSCIPAAGTVPLTTHIKYTVNNTCANFRRVSTQVNVDLASGKHIANWRRGFQTIQPESSAITQWNQTLPALGFVIGDNLFSFYSRDVTPPPYNQPPFAPSGSTNSDSCVVTGIAP